MRPGYHDTPTPLRNGGVARDSRLGWFRGYDPRDKMYRLQVPHIRRGRGPVSKQWPITGLLDQGSEGSCVGHGFAHWLRAMPTFNDARSRHAVKIYIESQKHDDFPGTNYSGTTVHGAAKYLFKIGILPSYVWTDNLEDFCFSRSIIFWFGLLGRDILTWCSAAKR